MKFSILTSYYVDNDIREKQLKRTVGSVLNQTEADFEYILCDDGSPKRQEFPDDKRIVKVEGPHLERVVSLNRGLDIAKGDWIVFIDADDELLSYALEAMSQMIDNYPDYKLFNYGSIHIHKDYVATIRGAFEPEQQDVGHVVFGGGNIVSGTFFFSRDCLEKYGGYPKEGRMWSPWDFSISAQKEFPEIKPYFTVNDNPNHPPGTPKELGNPWGQDFYLFYKLTRYYHSKPFQIPLIIVHHEKGEAWGHEIKKEEA